MTLPEPSSTSVDPAELFIRYLDFLRDETLRKVADLEAHSLDSSVVPSGWTPRQMLEHLVRMERRWFVWGFLGEPVEEPWGDQDSDGRWRSDADLADLTDRLRAGGRRTTHVLRTHALTAQAAGTGRFDGADDVPTLLAVAFHVLQEYARHVGHLDIARELADGLTGEA